MNYDLFLPPAVVENAAMSAVSSGRVLPGQLNLAGSPHRTGAPLFGERTADRTLRDSASEPLIAEEVESAVAAFNEVFKQANVSVRYQVDTQTGDLIISLVNRDTQEVLRQVPPEQILRMRQRLEEMLGVIFDQTA